jgi:multiple sugar transport system substrate-binding protein
MMDAGHVARSSKSLLHEGEGVKMKKTMLFSLAFLMAFFPVFANGQKEASAPKTETKTVIHFYDWAPTDLSIIEDFNKENPDIEVQFHSIPDNGGEKLVQLDILAMGGGDIDVMPGSDGEQMVRMKNGIYAPLDAFIERDGIDMEASFGDILSYARYNGVTYGYPFRSTVEGIWYNKDMFDAAGIPYPDGTWTWDEYKEIARKLTHGEGANKVFGTYTHTFNGQWAPVGNEKESWYGEDGLSNINSEAFSIQLERRKELDTLGYQLSFSQIQATKATQAAYFLGGKCAMVQAGSWLVQNIKDQENYPHSFRIGVAPLPRFDETVEDSNYFSVAASILAIPANSEHKEEAWRFIRYMVEQGASRIAGSGNYPCYRPAYNDELIATFIEGSGLELEDIRPLFGTMSSVSQKPTGAAAAEYQQSMQEQTPLFFNGEKSSQDVLKQIQKITDTAIKKEQSGK